MPRENAAGSQRERLLEATIDVVATKGYAATTVADLTSVAGISRTTLYEIFGGKERCLLAALDEGVGQVMSRVEEVHREASGTWPARTEAALATLLEELSAAPALARLTMVEASAAGPAGQQHLRRGLQRLAPLLDEGREYATAGEFLPESPSTMASGAVAGLIAEAVRTKAPETLPNLLPQVLFASLMPFLGTEAAAGQAVGKHL